MVLFDLEFEFILLQRLSNKFFDLRETFEVARPLNCMSIFSSLTKLRLKKAKWIIFGPS